MAVGPAVTTAYDTGALLGSTLANYRDKFEDNVSSNVALWWKLKQDGQVKKKVSGGERAVVQLLSGLNSTSKAYSGYDTLFTGTGAQDGMTQAEFPWSQHSVVVAINGIEEAANKGEAEIIDLLGAKVQQAEITAAEDFEGMFAGYGTGYTNKAFLGLGKLIGDATTTGSTNVGGIDATAGGNSFWRSIVERTVTALALTGTSGLNRAYNQLTRGTDRPNFALTSMDMFEKYEAILQPGQRFTDEKTASAGFQNLVFKTAPVVWTAALQYGHSASGLAAEVGSWYFLNTKYINLLQLGDKWMKQSDFIKESVYDARWAQILSYGQLVISNRRYGGTKLEGKT